MPTPPLDEPDTKITVRIWTRDYEALKHLYPSGWSGKIREIIRKYVKEATDAKRN